MSRKNTTEHMIKYLEDRINCKNVMKFAEEQVESILEQSDEVFISELTIDSTVVNFQIIKYNDSNESDPNNAEIKTKSFVTKMFDAFDFMTESNYTGFEYFPYLYGVLNCHNSNKSKIYVYYENFEGNLLQLINLLEHASEWYDIAFQLIVIDHYIRFINGYQYNANNLKSFLYKKNPKPYYKQYNIDKHNFSVSNKYLMVCWDIALEKRTNTDNEYTIIDAVLDYLKENPSLKIPPSNRIIKMFSNIKLHPENTIELLQQYYGNRSIDNKKID